MQRKECDSLNLLNKLREAEVSDLIGHSRYQQVEKIYHLTLSLRSPEVVSREDTKVSYAKIDLSKFEY